MRLDIGDHYVKLWASPADTYAWANKSGARWPCSDLSGKRLFAEFDRNGLVDMAINSGKGSQEVSAAEFSAFTSDTLRDKLPKGHPAWYVAVGQFV